MFPVLVVLDGEVAYGDPERTLHLDWTLDSLIAAGSVPATIVVAIASPGAQERFWEYVPREGGDAFLAGVRGTILPALRLQYRATSDPDSTSLLGISLGGLMAAYAGFARNDTFHRVAGLSSSYWAESLYPTMRTYGHGQLDRFYQDTGDGDDNSYFYVQGIERYAADSLGFTPGCDIQSVLAHGDHDYNSWSHRLPSILTYLLGPPGPGCMLAAHP